MLVPTQDENRDSVRSRPRRAVKSIPKYTEIIARVTEDENTPCNEDSSYNDSSSSIVSDSESVPEAPARTPQRRPRGILLPASQPRNRLPADGQSSHGRVPKSESSIVDLTTSKGDGSFNAHRQHIVSADSVISGKLSDFDEPLTTLKFSPPRSKSPCKTSQQQQLVTPPSSPTKSRLQSPSKKPPIPPTPHRPSIDAFWSQDVINEWNDQYSPRKTPKSTRRERHIVFEDSDYDVSPFAAPSRSPTRSPAKKDKVAIEKRKTFNEAKDAIATTFLAEVDRAISDGQVAQISSSTGGIHIIWSKKLSSTAGRANWRREAIRHRCSDGTTTETTHRHHASIELAEKVIDDEDRLMNVIAHEYCHLATFMISGVKNNPHGKEFKLWAAKCTKAFGDRGIEVTTKHTYAIAYKYVWVCDNGDCGVEYKRHSKSIDPVKQRCGKCKGTLVQTQPVPRKGQDTGKRSEYQQFVKREYERVKKERPGVRFGEIMAVLGRDFRKSKEAGKTVEDVKGEEKADAVNVEDVLQDFGGLSIAP